MRIVIVGGTGNIGSAVLGEVLALEEVDTVVVAARRVPDAAPPDPRVAWRRVDVAADLLDPLVLDADVVISLAWLIQPSRDPELTWRTNAVGTARLLDAVSRSRAHTVVVFSSVAAYSPASGQLVDETWPTHGASSAAYAREKAYVERLLDAFEATQPERRVVRLRPAFTFQRAAGVEQRRLFLSPWLPNRAVQPQRLPVLPWPRGLRIQVAHAGDVAAAVRSAIERRASGAFNLAAHGVLGAAEVGELFGARVVDVPARFVRTALGAAWHTHLTPAPPRLFDALVSLPVMSTERAQRELGWQPQRSAEDAIRAFVAGTASGEGGDTPPLDADSGPAHVRELRTGVGHSP
jgi:nucleoside-diphosphate-sugar epimerase